MESYLIMPSKIFSTGSTNSLVRWTLIICGLCGFLACSPADPKQQLAAARQAHEIELRAWTVKSTPAEIEGEEPVHEALLTLRVSDKGAPMQLDCITLSIVLQQDGEEVGRVIHELEIRGLADFGGTQEHVMMTPLPNDQISAIGVELAPADQQQLLSLCEARVLSNS